MYDETYTEVVIDDNIRERYNDDSESLIDHAYLEKLIFNEESSSVIFVNLHVVDYWELENFVAIIKLCQNFRLLTSRDTCRTAIKCLFPFRSDSRLRCLLLQTEFCFAYGECYIPIIKEHFFTSTNCVIILLFEYNNGTSTLL